MSTILDGKVSEESNDLPEMHEAEVGQLQTGLTEEGLDFKSMNLSDKYMSDIDALLESLDSHAMQRLETPANSFMNLSFNFTGTTIHINVTK